MPTIQNILLIKPGAIGDVLQLTPLIRALNKRYPAARISVIVGAGITADIFRHHPGVSETIIYDRTGVHRSLSALIGFWKELRKKQYDLVLQFQRSSLRSWLLASAAFPSRVLVYHRSRDHSVHAVRNYLDTVKSLGIAGEDLRLELYVGGNDRLFAAELLGSHGLRGAALVAFNPGASHAVNRWSADQFAALADRISEHTSARAIIVGGPDDIALAESIVAAAATNPVNLAGKTTLLQLGALLEQCQVLVTGDTGPMHIATAVNTRVIALFGAADPARTGPVGTGHRVIQARTVPCVPCRSRTCSNANLLECMNAIGASDVFEALTGMLASS